jgi:hypothetical protein
MQKLGKGYCMQVRMGLICEDSEFASGCELSRGRLAGAIEPEILLDWISGRIFTYTPR